MMRRRRFVTLLGGAALWPMAARAQQNERIRRVGALMSTREGDPEGQARFSAFRDVLQSLGWVDGHTLKIDLRWTGGNSGDIRKYAADLVALAPDVILASGGSVVGPLLQTTHTVPVVFTQTPDPVAAGFVASLSRPGGNVTGTSAMTGDLAGKSLEVLKEAIPSASRVAVLWNPDNSITKRKC